MISRTALWSACRPLRAGSRSADCVVTTDDTLTASSAAPPSTGATESFLDLALYTEGVHFEDYKTGREMRYVGWDICGSRV
jgi:hypothetical protein